MTRVHVYKFGPVETGLSVYVPISADVSLDPVEHADDVAALQAIASQQPGVVLLCSPELQAAAQALGFPVEKLPVTYEYARVTGAIEWAHEGVFDEIDDPIAYTNLANGIADFMKADVLARWPQRRPFDVMLNGDRSKLLAGWMTSASTVTLVSSDTDVDELASSSTPEQEKWLQTHDHLSVTFKTPPDYVVELIRGFFGIDVIPTFDKRENGEPAHANNEDAFVVAGVLAALATFDGQNAAVSETRSRGRIVRTLVGTAQPLTFVHQ